MAINGNHVFDYNHRVPISEVARLSIKGDVSVHRIVFSGGAASRGPEINHPAVPFSGSVFGAQGATPGRLVQISAEIPHHSRR